MRVFRRAINRLYLSLFSGCYGERLLQRKAADASRQRIDRISRFGCIAVHVSLALAVIAFCTFGIRNVASAIVAPHDASNDVHCEHCHTSHRSLGSYGYDNMCLTCHNSASGSKGRKFPFAPGHAANPFGTYTSAPPNNRVQTSHTWIGKEYLAKAGATTPKGIGLNKTNVMGSLSCAKCHNIHAPRSSATNSAPFLRALNERDEMCLDCHSPWKVSSHTAGTHPVDMNYTSATSKVMLRPDEYYNPPRNANADNPTSELNLKKGAVVCSTCHGAHYADSNSATFDSRTSLPFPKKGMLLRTDLRGSNANDINICTNCHKGKYAHNRKGQNVQCGDCHSAHVDDGTPGGPNVYLVRRFVNISTQYGAVRNKSILFRYTASSRNYAGANGACVTCHTIPAPGGVYPDEHLSTNVKVCNTCHFHNNYVGSFSGGCTSCHGFPPTQNVSGGPNGFALGYNGIDESHSPHGRHAAGGSAGYTFVCDECHKGKNHNTTPKSYQDVFLSKAGIMAGTAATYNAGPRQCSTMYCHSNGDPFDGSIFYKTSTWGTDGALSCTACHDGSSDTTGLSGRHRKHVAPSQYTYSCDKCHSGTATGSSEINDRTLHVNKQKDVSFKQGGAYNGTTRACSNTYCHSDAMGHPGRVSVKWTDSGPLKCFDCHKGLTSDNTPENCTTIGGTWDGANQICAPYVNMTSNGHQRLIGPQWIRKYPCYYCHNATMNADGSIKDKTKHADGTKTVEMATQWKIVGRPEPSYDSATKVCDNVYCHSDGTTDPEQVRPFAWNAPKTECNTCHGHPNGSCSNAGCHDGVLRNGRILKQVTGFAPGSEWMASMPMFPNTGAGTSRANSHTRHTQTNFTCDNCHAATIKAGACTTCHVNGIPAGGMGEVAHIDSAYHVNKNKDVVFKDGGTYNSVTKTCSNTACHTGGTDPVWGGSVQNAVTCLNCHGTTDPDKDRFNSTEVRINLGEWTTTGHGRYSSAGRYPVSGNPAANFPGNPCWYCHDNSVLHKDASNPYRLKLHPQYERRFDKECVYCHMQGLDSECLGCHNGALNSLAPNVTKSAVVTKHSGNTYLSGCRDASCHDTDQKLHKTGAGFWTAEEKADVRNQYMMMGVCLQCHDDDTGGQCTSCHTPPPEEPDRYNLGYDPGTGYIKPKKARASSAHFGYKHYRAYKLNGTWKGGKFCWDCHDPHGDANIYMIQAKVATTTEGKFGTPLTRADVSFTRKQTGLDYARTAAPYNGICNVCHSPASKHFTNASGDGHNVSRVCTTCHEHRFADSHASKQSCTTCHSNAKPVPKHGAFSLPRDCVKCHAGTVGKRMDITGQMKGTSHHVQGVELTNKHCYACHWESTKDGLIDLVYHEGFNYRNYSSAKNLKVDLVVWQPNSATPTVAKRPTVYKNLTTAIQFLASKIGTVNERSESTKVTNHCLSCHSDQNNDGTPFDDCKTPRQYAWDLSSVAARYSNLSTATWGRYASNANAAKKNITKAFSAHGNAVGNHGGWNSTTGVDAAIPDTRNGAVNVQCFDCHSSHGSKLVGTTSSYITFNGTRNGANLKETQAGKGGYAMTYKAAANSSGVNPYAAGAAQCFDCHETASVGTTPWGYSSTFGATAAIVGYKDTPKFGQGVKGSTVRFVERDSRKTIVGGHLKASSPLGTAAGRQINGLCTPCHDPHGVSPSLGADKAYAVPLLKGTWLTSPYKEDQPPPDPTGSNVTNDAGGKPRSWGRVQGHPTPTAPYARYNLDRTTFGAGVTMAEDDKKFAGLCLSCHSKSSLTDGINKNTNFKTVDRIHESVKGWGANTEHAYSCSKCHQPHNSGLPRLMQLNCLDYKHRGNRASGGAYWAADSQSGAAHGYNEHRGYPIASTLGNSASFEATASCHAAAPMNSGSWPNKNFWNNVTPW